MLLSGNPDTLFSLLKLKQSDQCIIHKLSGNWSANQFGKFGSTNSKILFNLNDTYFVCSTFSLNRQNIVSASPVNANIDFISFHLPNIRHGCSQMVLQRITGQASKNIDQPIITKFGQKSLLIIQ